MRIVLAIKKTEILGTIILRGYSFPQEIQNFIEILRLITFGGCNSPQEIQNFIRILRPKIFKNCSTPQDSGVEPIFEKLY